MKEKVIITEVKEPKTLKKGGHIYPFKAKIGDKELNFQTFIKSIGDALVKDKEVEIAYETKEREYNGNIYLDHTVSQMWIDGNLLEDKKEYKGKSLEERQEMMEENLTTALARIISSEPNNIPADIYYAFWVRARGIYSKYIKESTPAPSGGQPAIEKTAAVKQVVLPTFNKPGEFVAFCQKEFGISATEILDELKVLKASEIKDYQKAYDNLCKAKAYEQLCKEIKLKATTT